MPSFSHFSLVSSLHAVAEVEQPGEVQYPVPDWSIEHIPPAFVQS
jgi:hypothetical protein